MGDQADVAAQYAVDTLLARIEAALVQAGLDAPVLDWRDLTPLDHFHSRGIAATAELAAALAPEPSAHVLDIGCGLGGPARFPAGTYGCRVTGVNLTPEPWKTEPIVLMKASRPKRAWSRITGSVENDGTLSTMSSCAAPKDRHIHSFRLSDQFDRPHLHRHKRSVFVAER